MATTTATVYTMHLSTSNTGVNDPTPTMVSGYGFNKLTASVTSGGSSYTAMTAAATTTLTSFYTTATKTGVAITNTYYYNSNATAGSTTVASTTASATTTQTLHCTSNTAASAFNTAVNVSVPAAVRSSVGTWNNAYAGLSTSVGNMTQAVASTATVISRTSNGTYYSLYRTNVTVYVPTTSNCSAQPMYRNQWFTSNTAMSNTVISNTTTGTVNANPNVPSGYNFAGMTTAASLAGTSYSTVASATSTTITSFWAIATQSLGSATFKYSSNASGTVTSTSTSGIIVLYCHTSTSAIMMNSGIVSPGSGTAPYGTTFVGYASNVNTMTTTNSYASGGVYYAVYRNASITNYYYNGSTAASRTLYRNGFMNAAGATTYTMVLSTTNTGTANYTTAVGPNNAPWAGLATSSTASIAYSTVASAATSTATKLYTIYQYNITYSKGSTVASIGATSGSCRFVTGTSTCRITLPSITAASGYAPAGWNTTSASYHGYPPGCSHLIGNVTNEIGTLYATAQPTADCIVLDYYACGCTGDMSMCADLTPEVCVANPQVCQACANAAAALQQCVQNCNQYMNQCQRACS